MASSGENPDEELHMRAIWAIREDDLATLKNLVEQKGVKLTHTLKNGLRPASEPGLWKGGALSDYADKVIAAENASVLGRGVGGAGVSAPARARFSKKGNRHAAP